MFRLLTELNSSAQHSAQQLKHVGHQFETETMFWTYVCVSSLLTLVTVRASECGLITITGRHPGKHARQITSPPMGACHRVACAPWTPIWVTMKYRGNIKKEEFLSKHFFPLLFFTLSRLRFLKIVQVQVWVNYTSSYSYF